MGVSLLFFIQASLQANMLSNVSQFTRFIFRRIFDFFCLLTLSSLSFFNSLDFFKKHRVIFRFDSKTTTTTLLLVVSHRELVS